MSSAWSGDDESGSASPKSLQKERRRRNAKKACSVLAQSFARSLPTLPFPSVEENMLAEGGLALLRATKESLPCGRLRLLPAPPLPQPRSAHQLLAFHHFEWTPERWQRLYSLLFWFASPNAGLIPGPDSSACSPHLFDFAELDRDLWNDDDLWLLPGPELLHLYAFHFEEELFAGASETEQIFLGGFAWRTLLSVAPIRICLFPGTHLFGIRLLHSGEELTREELGPNYAAFPPLPQTANPSTFQGLRARVSKFYAQVRKAEWWGLRVPAPTPSKLQLSREQRRLAHRLARFLYAYCLAYAGRSGAFLSHFGAVAREAEALILEHSAWRRAGRPQPCPHPTAFASAQQPVTIAQESGGCGPVEAFLWMVESSDEALVQALGANLFRIHRPCPPLAKVYLRFVDSPLLRLVEGETVAWVPRWEAAWRRHRRLTEASAQPPPRGQTETAESWESWEADGGSPAHISSAQDRDYAEFFAAEQRKEALANLLHVATNPTTSNQLRRYPAF